MALMDMAQIRGLKDFCKKLIERISTTEKDIADIKDTCEEISKKTEVTYIDQKFQEVVDDAPEQLDTLQKLAQAVNNDENFADNINTSLVAKLDKTGGTVDGDLTITGMLDGDVFTGKAAAASHISNQEPRLASATESNEIAIRDYENGSMAGEFMSVRKAIDFDWYNSRWSIGNIRSEGEESAGFGFGFKADKAKGYNSVSYIDVNGAYHGNVEGTSTSATFPVGFCSRNTDPSWGLIKNTGVSVTDWQSAGGGDIAFTDKDGQLNVFIDGDYYANEGLSKVFHEGNYNNYVPTRTGGGASGTWEINITGSAGALNGFVNSRDNSPKNCNDMNINGMSYYLAGGPSRELGATTDDGALYSQAHSAPWAAQIAQDYRNGNLFTRGKNDGNWTAWRKVAYSDDTAPNTNVLNCLGPQTAITGREEGGLRLHAVYQNGYPCSYGNVLTASGGGAGQLLLGWSGNTNGIERLFYRNRRDCVDTWSDWKAIAFTDDKPANAEHADRASIADNADTVDGCHEYNFLRYRDAQGNGSDSLWGQIGIRQINDGYPEGIGDGYTWGAVVSLPAASARLDIWYNHACSENGDGLCYRSGWDGDKKPWQRILDTRNFTRWAAARDGDTIYTNNWFRSRGNTGWYNENYGGGWYMEDATWIRAYNSKSIYTPAVMRADGGFEGTLRGNCEGTSTRTEYIGNDEQYMRFHWNGQGGQPTWLWGGNEGGNMYVWNPANFSVNYANSAGSVHWNNIAGKPDFGGSIIAQSLGVNGYTKFASGLIIQWGWRGGTGGKFNFPIVFPNRIFGIYTGVADGNVASTWEHAHIELDGNYDLASAARRTGAGWSAQDGYQMMWLAIGC